MSKLYLSNGAEARASLPVWKFLPTILKDFTKKRQNNDLTGVKRDQGYLFRGKICPSGQRISKSSKRNKKRGAKSSPVFYLKA